MASGREIHLHDLPPELLNTTSEKEATGADWESMLRNWVDQQLLLSQAGTGEQGEVAKQAIHIVETILIKAALDFTHGKRHEAIFWATAETPDRKIKDWG
jgi:two-component system nitrogen regulation response regulator GlnG